VTDLIRHTQYKTRKTTSLNGRLVAGQLHFGHFKCIEITFFTSRTGSWAGHGRVWAWWRTAKNPCACRKWNL